VPPEVLLEMAKPIIHHRTPQFSQILGETLAMLSDLYRTKHPVLIIAGTGTLGMEAVVANWIEPGEKALVIRGGKFGERWGELVEAYGGKMVPLDVPWGEGANPQDVERILTEDPEIRYVFVQACETSTATEHPIEEIAKVVRRFGDRVLLAVDGITGVGVFPLPLDAWGMDALVCGSQKALMLPPGLATVGLSERGWERVKKNGKKIRFYLNLLEEYKAQVEERTTAWTAPVSLVVGLHAVLKRIFSLGLEEVYRRHAILAEATQAGLKNIGLLLYSRAPSRSVTAAWVPEGVKGGELVRYLRDRMGVGLAGGQGKLKGKIIRIGHMGFIDEYDILSALSALEIALNHFGVPVRYGLGVEAASPVIKRLYQ
jgi:aspartate aminotransferase-like enzyme